MWSDASREPRGSPTARMRGEPPDYTPRLYTKHHDPADQSKVIARKLLLIVAGNLVATTFLVLTLWEFTQIGDLNKYNTPWIKRTFNAVTITLTATLSIGIGTRSGILSGGHCLLGVTTLYKK